MNAIILAAGFGSRLMPLTKDMPKCMVEYKGKRIIDYELEALRAAGISNIAIVGGDLNHVLENYLTNRDIRFYKNNDYAHTNMVETLFCARDFIQECIDKQESLLVSYADIVYFADCIESLIDNKHEFCIAIDMQWRALWEKRFSDPLSDAESLKLRGDYILELGKKPSSYADIEGQYMGLFTFSHTFLHKVLEFYDSLDRNATYDGKDFRNMYMTSFLQGLIDTYHNAICHRVYGKWCEVDSIHDLDIDIG